MLVELTVMMLGCMEKMSQDAEAGSSSAGSQMGRLNWDSPCLAFSLPRQKKIEKKGEEDEKR